MRISSRRRLEALAPIGLEELNGAAGLQSRVDRKYVVSADELDAVVDRLADSHRILEIDGRRVFRYRTTYYDTSDLLSLREHLQGRRRRFKCRKRLYVDSDRCQFEVKLKGSRGETVKHAVTTDWAADLLPHEREFARDTLLSAYDRDLPIESMAAVLTVECRRITLAAPADEERLTIDVALDFGGARLSDGHAIVESKSRTGWARVDEVMRELGIRPEGRCSKFCLGLALRRSDVRANDFIPLLRRCFVTGPEGADGSGAVAVAVA